MGVQEGAPAKLRVGIVFGGRSGEHEVSLMSARSVVAALDPDKYDVIGIGVTREGRWLLAGDPLGRLLQEAGASIEAGPATQPVTLVPQPGGATLVRLEQDGRDVRGGKERDDEPRGGEARSGSIGTDGGGSAGMVRPAGADLGSAGRPDVIFPLIHGTHGEDGSLQGLLDLAEIPYVGAGVLASSVGMDKAVFKALMQAHGIPVAPWRLVLVRGREGEPAEWCDLAAGLDYPLFVKPANGGSSLGVAKVKAASGLEAAIRAAAEYDPRVLLERGIVGRELECAVLGNDDPEASTVGEVIPGHEFYDYDDKYFDDKSRTEIPARITPGQMAAVRDLSVRAFRAIDGAGMARVDFFLEEATGQVFLNEINTIPGFTRISMYPKLWEASGVPFPLLVDRLILLALERAERLRQRKISP